MVTYLGSLVQSCCGEGGALQTNLTGVCGERSRCLGHTGFAPTHSMCAFPVYTAQAPGCSAGELSNVGPGLHALPRSKPLRFRFSGTPQRRRLGWARVLCPSQVRAAQRPGAWRAHSFSLAVRLITSPVPAPWFPGCAAGVQFQEGRVSPLGSRSLPVTLLADVNRPGSQEDLVSNRSQFGGECHLWSRDCPSPSGSGCCPPASGEGRDWSRAS